MTRIIIPVVRSGDKLLVSPHFGRTPEFALVEITGDSYRIIEVTRNPFMEHEHGRGQAVIQFVYSRGADAIIVGGIGPRAVAALKSIGVRVYAVPREGIELDEAIKLFMKGMLTEVSGEEYPRHHEKHSYY